MTTTDLVLLHDANRRRPRDRYRHGEIIALIRAIGFLLYAVALTMLNQGFDAVLLLSATILASGTGQGLSLLGHVLIGRHHNEAAMALFRTALIGGGAVGALMLGAAWFMGSLSPAAVLAACQFAYVLAAGVLMVLEANLLLLSVLAPAVVLAMQLLMGALFGILGVLFADPILATLKVLLVDVSEREARKEKEGPEVVAGET